MDSGARNLSIFQWIAIFSSYCLAYFLALPMRYSANFNLLWPVAGKELSWSMVDRFREFYQ